MSSEKDQDSYKQPNYMDHLKRVRQVKRTLDVNAPDFTSKQLPGERLHVSHESIKDQAVSRKTRRPAEDYAVGAGLFGAESQAESTAPPQAETQRPAAEIAPSNKPEQPARPKHVVAPTLLEKTAPPGLGELSVAPKSQVSGAENSAKSAEGKFAEAPSESSSKGLLDSADKPRIAAVKNDFGDGLGAPKKKGRATQFVAKTLLDHNAILKAQALRQKARVEQEISLRQQQPVKIIEPIKARKEVRSCPFSWTEDSSTERFKHCSKCQSTIYNLDGMEFSDAENLIFKRENRKKFVLFKRPDGKFMTSDCPFEQKRKQQIIGIVAICICVVACIAGFLILMPPSTPGVNNSTWGEPAPSTVTTQSWSVDEPTKSSTPTKSSGTKSSGTSQHYEAGDALPTEPASGVSTNKPVQKPVSPSEEQGDFWEFSGQ